MILLGYLRLSEIKMIIYYVNFSFLAAWMSWLKKRSVEMFL